MKIRLDQLLVKKMLAPSRTKAQDLIRAGEIEIRQGNGYVVADDPGLKVSEDIEIRVREGAEILKYVSRAGLKLEAALRQTGLEVNGKRCIDIGQSTGGFTEALLAAGAAEVWGLDVGHGQLHPRLREHPRVRCFEGLDIREAVHDSRLRDQRFDVATVDLSFISLEKVVSEIYYFINAGGEALLLVKPQFELDRAALNKQGLVKDEGRIGEIERRLANKLRDTGFVINKFFASEVKGKDGNQEYFFYVNKT